MQQPLLLEPGLDLDELLLVVWPHDEHLELGVQHLCGLRAVAPVAVHVDGAGGGRVVDEEDAGDNILGPDGAGDRVVGDEVLNILLKLMTQFNFCVLSNNIAVAELSIVES